MCVLFIRAYVESCAKWGACKERKRAKRRCIGEEKHGAEGRKDTRDCLLVRFGRDVIHSDVTSL